MAGHSHSANIKHRKAAVDAKRGKVFTRHARAIMACVREKGKDPAMNPTLRLLVDKARADNMPKDNIERSILKGAGELEGETITEVTYEGYGAHGSAVIVDAMTDNPNRTTPEIRHLFGKFGGNMGEKNCVSWDFKTCGVIVVTADGADEDELMMAALDAGAEDMSREGDVFEIITPPESLATVSEALGDYSITLSEVTKVANNKLTLDVDQAKSVMKLIDAFEDHDDVQNVYSNLDITEELASALMAE